MEESDLWLSNQTPNTHIFLWGGTFHYFHSNLEATEMEKKKEMTTERQGRSVTNTEVAEKLAGNLPELNTVSFVVTFTVVQPAWQSDLILANKLQ